MDNKAAMEIATRNEEDKSREDSTLASCVRIWKRKHDIARFTENRRTAVLSTLHENQISTESAQVVNPFSALAVTGALRNEIKNATPGIEMNRHLGGENAEETLRNSQGQEVLNSERKIKSSAFSNLKDRARTMSHNVIPNINNYRARYNNFPATVTIQPAVNNTLQSQESIIDIRNDDEPVNTNVNENVPEVGVEKIKFGWIQGVLIRNMMSIWGVMLFLRLSWVVGNAGIGETLVIIGISTFITMITALSMSAISTNGEIGGGGTYFVMSRVLGPEFGGSIGIIFTIANVMDCALNVVGFAQTVIDMMMQYGGLVLIDGGDNDIRIIGGITMIFVCGVCGMGSRYETMMKNVMIVIMGISLANFFAGSIIGPQSEIEQAQGFIGFSMDLLNTNWKPAYTFTDGQMQNFISVFSVYFPACIGILAGANVSGDLKDPNKAIPKGTILAIILCSIVYAAVAIVCAATMTRAATGQVNDLHNGTYLDCITRNCSTSGLYYDYQSMSLISAFAPLNHIGCIAATLSTALSDFVSCPALLEVIAADKLYPYWMVGFLGKGYGKSKIPYRAFGFTFLLSLAFVLIARLDTIALLISDFFLATFALMNFSTFHISLIKPIGWRPTFKYYNTWLSLLTGILSIVVIILISLPIALITIAIVVFFYLVVLYRKPEVNWGSSTQAQTYRAALTTIQHLVHVDEHVKNYRPQILVLTGLPSARPALVDFAYLICKNNSLMLCGNIIQERLTHEMNTQLQQKAYRYLRFTNIKGFCSVADNSNLHTGVANMLGLAGVGKVRPNILMMGFKNDWSTCDPNLLDQYVLAVNTGFEMNVGVAILRLREGLDCSDILADIDDLIVKTHQEGSKNISETKENLRLRRYSSKTSSNSDTITTNLTSSTSTVHDIEEIEESETTGQTDAKRTVVLGGTKDKKSKKSKKQAITFRDREGNELPKSVMNKIILFRKRQKKDTVDVWWLSDDGGLTLLLPVIINTRSNWSETKLRVFCTASGVEELEKEHKGMAVLLSKFRIDYSDLVIISDISEPPKNRTKQWFDGIVQPFLLPGTNGPHITVEELDAYQSKTDRYLKLRELLLDHSSDSNLVVMTLPTPRVGMLTSPLYMAWLEALTADMPPFMLVRGNQTSVLTFYV